MVELASRTRSTTLERYIELTLSAHTVLRDMIRTEPFASLRVIDLMSGFDRQLQDACVPARR